MTHSNRITLDEGQFGWDYVVTHDDGRDLYIQSDWEYPGLAMTFGWSPCSWCRRRCHGATDGTINCPSRTAGEHIGKAQEWLDAHIGRRVADPGYFEEILYPMNPDMIRAIYQLANEYHSGQWSRGYRLLCRVQQYARRHGIDLDRETRASQKLYRQLAKRYATQL
jgi:hypothetical protein